MEQKHHRIYDSMMKKKQKKIMNYFELFKIQTVYVNLLIRSYQRRYEISSVNNE